jgi:hypothetical protein
MLTQPLFHGTATDFTVANYVTILLITLVYALLSGWVLLGFYRLLAPVVDRVGRVALRIPGLFPLLVLVGSLLAWYSGEVGQGLVVVLLPFIVLSSLLGYGQAFCLVPLVLLFIVCSVYALWYPVGAWTGIGWMGCIPYGIFVFKLVATFYRPTYSRF